MRRLVITLVFAALAGLVLWLVLNPSGGDSTLSQQPDPNTSSPASDVEGGNLRESVASEESNPERNPINQELPPELDPKLWEGDRTFYGAVVDPEGFPLSGVDVSAFPYSIDVFGPSFADVVSDSEGRIVVHRVGDWYRLTLSAKGFLTKNHSLGPDDMYSSLEVPTRLTLEPLLMGRVEGRVTDSKGLPVSSYGMRLVYEDPNPIVLTTTQTVSDYCELAETGAFQFANVIAGQDFSLRCERTDGFVLLKRTFPPLAGAETRAINFVLPKSIAVSFVILDASTGETAVYPRSPVTNFVYGTLSYRWTGDVSPFSSNAEFDVDKIPSSIEVPGPGILSVKIVARGFLAYHGDHEVEDESQVRIELQPLREIRVHLETESGRPLVFEEKKFWKRDGWNIRFSGGTHQFLMPQLDVVVALEDSQLSPLLKDVDRDVTADKYGRSVRISRVNRSVLREDFSEYQVYAPHSEPLKIGVYYNRHLATIGEVASNETTVTLTVPIEDVALGEIRVSPVDRESGEPVHSFQVFLYYKSGGGLERIESYAYTVQRESVFTHRIPPGDYLLVLQTENLLDIAFVRNFKIGPGEFLDFGNVEVVPNGDLDITVTDELGTPIAGAEVRLFIEALGEYALKSRADPNSSMFPSNARGNIRIRGCSGIMRLEVRSPGFVTATQQAYIPPHESTSTVVNLSEGVLASLAGDLQVQLSSMGATEIRAIHETNGVVYDSGGVGAKAQLRVPKMQSITCEYRGQSDGFKKIECELRGTELGLRK